MKKSIKYKPTAMAIDEIDRLNNPVVELNYLRSLRKPLLTAFDIYKSNVLYGIIEETEEEHSQILEWYNSLLTMNAKSITSVEEAIKNVPEKIKQYLK